MTAPVRIDASAWGDLRFATLARLCGFADADHALIKCSKIWSWQTEHYTDAQPTYVVEVELVESALGPGGAGHLVRARLAEEGPDGLRIRGSRGRIEWLFKARRASKQGGDATKRKHENKTWPDGLPSGVSSAGPETGLTPGDLTLSPDPSSSEDTYTRARHPAVGRIARAAWDLAAKKRQELAAANVTVAPWALHVGSDHSGWIALLDRAGELLVSSTAEQAEATLRNRVEVAFAKAIHDGEGQWFTPLGMFSRKSMDAFADSDPKAFARKAPKKRGPGELIGPAPPRSDHPESTTLIPISEL